MAFVVTDPRWEPREFNALERFAQRFLRDERDLIFVQTASFMAMTLIPVGLALLLIPGLARWWVAPFYWAVTVPVFLDRYVLMVHAVSHRVLFKREHDWMNRWVFWLMGPFFGHTPTAFFVHHMGMHHPENNLAADLSSTLPYQRDKLSHFAHYWARFFFAGTVHLSAYLYRRGRKKLLARLLLGELAWLVLIVAAFAYNPSGAFIVLLFPFCFVRFAMMAGNWSQHAFVDVNDPANEYTNSITLVNCRHNRRCYNDGYHVVHHLKANAHWSEHPELFEKDLANYAANRALVFQNVFSYQKIFVLLMTGNYDKLATHFVNLGETQLSHDEVVALIKERARGQRGPIRGIFELDPFPAPVLEVLPAQQSAA